MARHIHRQPAVEPVAALLETAGLPTHDLNAAMLAHFFVCGDPAAPAGVVGIELFGSAALLRSLAVRESERGRGTGHALVATAESYARETGVSSLYLLTETAATFFSNLGYAALARDNAPPAIRGTAQFAGLCPDSAHFMHKALSAPGARPQD